MTNVVNKDLSDNKDAKEQGKNYLASLVVLEDAVRKLQGVGKGGTFTFSFDYSVIEGTVIKKSTLKLMNFILSTMCGYVLVDDTDEQVTFGYFPDGEASINVFFKLYQELGISLSYFIRVHEMMKKFILDQTCNAEPVPSVIKSHFGGIRKDLANLLMPFLKHFSDNRVTYDQQQSCLIWEFDPEVKQQQKKKQRRSRSKK